MECAGFYTDAKCLVKNDQCIPDLKLQCVLGGLVLWMDLTSKITMCLAVTVELCLVKEHGTRFFHPVSDHIWANS